MFRRRQRRSFRRRPPTQWIVAGPPLGGYQSPTTAMTIGGLPQGNELLGTTMTGATSDPPQMGRFRVERIVGDIGLTQNVAGATAALSISMGIILLSRPAAGLTFPDPGSADDATLPWLWMRTWVFTESGSVQGSAIWTYWLGLVDIRVKRIVRPDQRLMLFGSVKAITAGGIATYSLCPFLRTLITRVA